MCAVRHVKVGTTSVNRRIRRLWCVGFLTYRNGYWVEGIDARLVNDIVTFGGNYFAGMKYKAMTVCGPVGGRYRGSTTCARYNNHVANRRAADMTAQGLSQTFTGPRRDVR